MTAADQDPFRWALAGYGAGGRTFHRPLISSATGLQLVAVVTGSAERRAQLHGDLPEVSAVGSLPDLLALGVQGVTITTPSATHTALAHEALDLGLHVVVDKPFALTAADARKLADHAEVVGLLAIPYQNRRWDSDLLTVQKLIGDDLLGDVHSFTSRIDRFRPVKGSWHGGTVEDGGGTLLDLGPHLVDQALLLFGPVLSVHAQLRTVRDGAGAEDVIELHLRHAGGVDSTLAAGMASAAPGPRFQLNGSKGGFVIDGFDIQEEQLKSGASPATLGADWGVEPESAWGRFYELDGSSSIPSERGAWDSYYPAVANAIAGAGAPPVRAEDAIATAVVLDAARESAATDSVVRLS
jgi:predicted dehydrogenase